MILFFFFIDIKRRKVSKKKDLFFGGQSLNSWRFFGRPVDFLRMTGRLAVVRFFGSTAAFKPDKLKN